MNDPQRDYYAVTSAGETFALRLAAIRDVIVPGSRIVDIGCNDGRFSLALLESGHASEATGIDLENFVATAHPRFRFVKTDLRESGTSLVPQADAILCLNVAHHLLLSGAAFVQRFIGELLDRAETVFVDLGSLTETGPWPWRQVMERLWDSDEAVAQDLFAPARWRRPLCTYRSQNGTRVMWKLSAREADFDLEIEQRYRRTCGQQWQVKRLIEVADEDATPAGCTGEVLFCRAKRRETNERFWTKRYAGARDVAWRATAEREVVAFMRRFAAGDTHVVLPVGHRNDLGAVYPFHESLFTGTAIHYFDRHLLPRKDRVRYERLMHAIIDDGPFAGLPLGVIADPQAIVTEDGVRFVDWEPSHHYTALVEHLIAGSSAERFAVLTAMWDLNAGVPASIPDDVRKEIVEALATDLFREIARERLRVERNRRLRGTASGVVRLRPLAALREAAIAVRSEAVRLRRNGPVVRLRMRSAIARLRRKARPDS